jgi:exodeoxyribonuclease VII large subunit
MRSLGARLRGATLVQLEDARERVRGGARELSRLGARAAERRRQRVAALAGRLHALSPLATLARGYGVARDAEGRALTSVERFTAGQAFELLLRDGSVQARVEDVTPGAGGG